jgi:hypothetical protein
LILNHHSTLRKPNLLSRALNHLFCFHPSPAFAGDLLHLHYHIVVPNVRDFRFGELLHSLCVYRKLLATALGDRRTESALFHNGPVKRLRQGLNGLLVVGTAPKQEQHAGKACCSHRGNPGFFQTQ